MKKIIILILFIMTITIFLPTRNNIAYAAPSEETQDSDDRYNIKETIDSLDLDALEEYYLEFNISQLFDNKPIKDVVYDLIVGNETISAQTILNVLLYGVKNNITGAVKLLLTIIIIVAVSALASLGGDKTKTQKVVNYFIIILLLSVVSGVIANSISSAAHIILKIKSVMEVISPVLLSLLVAVGGSASSAAYSPIIILLTGGVMQIVGSVLITIISLYFILSVLVGLNSSIKLDKFKGFISSSFKWILGFIFTIFIGYLSLSGITASTRDGISIKTAKYALKSYLPLVGGYLSDSYEIFRAGSVLIKNAVGSVGVIILFAIIIYSVITLILYNLCFKFACGITEPFATRETTSFLSSLSVVFNYLIACIVSVFMMCFITIIVIISTANSL